MFLRCLRHLDGLVGDGCETIQKMATQTTHSSVRLGVAMKIMLLRLRVSNAYLLVGRRPILVDTGTAKDTETIRSNLRAHNVEFSDLALIIHTHVHSDHMGSTAEILSEARCPIAYHPADQEIVDRSHNGQLKGVGLRGKIMSRFFSQTTFDSVNANIQLDDGMSLNDYGADATVIETPGHTAGSISIVTRDGDAIIGDVMMGGYMGGTFLPQRPNFHYFADDVQQTMTSLDNILARSTGKLYVGHGGPLNRDSVAAWRNRKQSAQQS